MNTKENNKNIENEKQTALNGLSPDLIYACFKKKFNEATTRIIEESHPELNTSGLLIVSTKVGEDSYNILKSSFGYEDDILSTLTSVIIQYLDKLDVKTIEEKEQVLRNYLKFFITQAKEELFRNKDFEDEYDEE